MKSSIISCCVYWAVLAVSYVYTATPSGQPAKETYWPAELSSSKLTPEDIKTFMHFATYMQNSNIMQLESKLQGNNVLGAVRNFSQSKVGDYFKVLLRMWAKFSAEERVKHKTEIFKNLEVLKVPENFKSGFKSMFEHVDNLQGMLATVGAASGAAGAPVPPVAPANRPPTPIH